MRATTGEMKVRPELSSSSPFASSAALGAGGFESGRGGMEDVARPVEAA